MSRYDLEPEPDDLRNEVIRTPENDRPNTPKRPSKPEDLEPETRYNLRGSELQTLVDLGTFRVVRRDDLAEYGYAGDDDLASRDLAHLSDQGLIQQRISYPEREVYLTLSRAGQHYIQNHRPGTVSEDQAFHRGFLKRREAKHDATLYRVYQREAARIQDAGGTITRVVLDSELKQSINRRLANIHSLPADEQQRARQEIAEAHELKVVSGKIALPDLRLEYETPDREQTKVDIELLSGDYRSSQITTKARAGFRMYALSQDAARLRPALQDPELMQEIFSL
jgi:hypothetical protein